MLGGGDGGVVVWVFIPHYLKVGGGGWELYPPLFANIFKKPGGLISEFFP